jgi:hypothetical protein
MYNVTLKTVFSHENTYRKQPISLKISSKSHSAGLVRLFKVFFLYLLKKIEGDNYGKYSIQENS